MAESSSQYHEPYDLLSDETRNMHRAIVSLMEELEAIDWYQQRIEACTDDDLKAILLHNKHEEVEHALMSLEWIRRHLPKLDEEARDYLFTEGPIVRLEEQVSEEHGGDEVAGSLGIGSLRGGV
ncbi:MAG: ferritin-like domain-containing protein [Thermoanaerobaculia bacterium]|nr:ferritin-like domain-containing protein [Thermoanaerobaculia bacterium]